MGASTNDHRTVLVTGGAGFVGSTMALRWKEGYPSSRVICLDNLKRRGSELNLPRLRAAGVEFVHGDVRDANDLANLPTIDLMIECSAEPSVMAGYGSPTHYVTDTNLIGTINCLNLAARDKADTVFLSTSRVYPMELVNRLASEGTMHRFTIKADPGIPGASPEGISEDFPLTGLRSLYGATKLASELLIAEYAHIHGFRYVIDRCGVIAGPWQMGKTDQGFILLWLARHHWKQPLKYFGFGGTGKQVRDVLHVDDLFDLVVAQVNSMDTMHARTFNVGGGLGNSVSLSELSAMCAAITGNTLNIGSEPLDREADIRLYITDNKRIHEATGWKPERTMDHLLQDCHAWLVENENTLKPILG
jgi:CDP-paratose 2-epimerase